MLQLASLAWLLQLAPNILVILGTSSVGHLPKMSLRRSATRRIGIGCLERNVTLGRLTIQIGIVKFKCYQMRTLPPVPLVCALGHRTSDSSLLRHFICEVTHRPSNLLAYIVINQYIVRINHGFNYI